MKPFIRILYLEDEPNDVILAQAKLEEAGLIFRLTVVQSGEEFENALQQNEYDIILSDFRLPMYDGISALRFARQTCPDIPFVFVSGTMGEEVAVEALKQGATDYVLKQNMLRFASAVERALREAENQREREKAKDELHRSHDLLRAIIESVPTAIIGLDLEGNVNTVWNPAAERLLGWSAQEAMGQPLPIRVEKEEISSHFRERIIRGESLAGVEVRRQHFNGTFIDYSIYSSPLHDAEGRITGSIAVLVDITERIKVEERLREKHNQLVEAQHIAHIGNWWHDLVTGEIFWSEEFFKIIGREPQKITEELALAIMHPDDQHIIQHAMDEAAAGKVKHDHEFRIIRPDGDIRWIHNRWIGIYDETGKEIKRIGTHQDITERKRAEDALRDSEEEKTILNQIANVFLTVPDEAIYGEVLEVVLKAMRSTFGIFGYIDENGDLVIPSLISEIWEECQVSGKSIVFPAGSWGNSLWGRSIREKKAFSSAGPFHIPEGHIHIDHFLTVPIIYGQETIGLISVANKEGGYTEKDKDLLERVSLRVSPILRARLERDIQELRRIAAESDLKESEEKYRLLITNAGEAIFIVQDEVVKFPNPKALEMIGYSEEELAEIPFVDLIHPGDRDWIFERYIGLLAGERHSEANPFRIIDKKGKEMWVKLTSAPIIWEKKPGILCFLRDVTEEKKLEAQFAQAQKMEAVGQLAGGVAHDFNNMLTLIIGNAELAQIQVAPSDSLHAKLQEIEQAAKRSADITRQLLAFARKQTIAPKVLNLNDILSDMLNILRRLIGEDIDLAWKPNPELWPVKMDPSQIDQILANLCVNARDAIEGVGKIIIETGNIAFDETYCSNHPGFVPGEYVMLAVSDDGCGMNEETQAHLFEPFFTTKEIGKGTGLGLAIVYGIVKQNNGFINVYSEQKQGTTFKIYFPRHSAAPVETLEKKSVETLMSGTETVLIVEDERAILEMGKKMLERLGYSVLISKTPREAISLVEEYTSDIHLLITDVIMPEMNGKELAEWLASIKPHLKCLYMSGYTTNIIAHRGILEEGVHFIQKPFSMKDLATKIRDVLDQ